MVLSSCSIMNNENNYYTKENQKLLLNEFEVKLPKTFHAQKEKYEEGVIYIYSFADSAYIIIFQGTLMEFPMDKYVPLKDKKTTKRRIIVGKENNKHWRKDVIGNIRIYYDNVTIMNKSKYDNILNNIKIRPIK